MLQQLSDMAATGLDMSPGDPVAAWAVAEIARLKAEADLLKAALRWCLENVVERMSDGTLWSHVAGERIEIPPEFAAVIAEAVGSKTASAHPSECDLCGTKLDDKPDCPCCHKLHSSDKT